MTEQQLNVRVRRWRPRRRLLISVILGIAATAASAWGPAVWSGFNDPYLHMTGDYPRPGGLGTLVSDVPEKVEGWLTEEWWASECDLNSPVHDRETRDDHVSAVPSWASARVPLPDPPRTPQHRISTETYAYGIPLRAAAMTVVWDRWDTAANKGIACTRQDMWVLRYGKNSAFMLPTRIHWPGFIADVAFWSAVFAVPMLVIPAARRGIRRRRGRCSACGYSRAGIDAAAPCPECGTDN